MHNICWQFFKKSGSIEAYLYIHNKSLYLKRRKKREIINGNNKHPGYST